MDLIALIVGLTGLIAALGNIHIQRKQTHLAQEKQTSERELRQQELDSLEHNMVVEIAQKYRDFSVEYDARIASLTEKIEQYKGLLEESEAENNELKQTNLLYEQRIKFLVDNLQTQHKETQRLKGQLLEQNRKLRELESKVANGHASKD